MQNDLHNTIKKLSKKLLDYNIEDTIAMKMGKNMSLTDVMAINNSEEYTEPELRNILRKSFNAQSKSNFDENLMPGNRTRVSVASNRPTTAANKTGQQPANSTVTNTVNTENPAQVAADAVDDNDEEDVENDFDEEDIDETDQI